MQCVTSSCHSCSSDTPISNKAPSLRIALVGNPNCGKTTLFNALTGSRQRVGNWSGVTVERKSGYFTFQDITTEVVDLPGVYSLTIAADAGAIDERIACEFILNQSADIIVNIVDGSHLERHLYLTSQLIEMGVPIVLAVNMMDAARAKGMQIDCAKLSKELGCPVVALEAHKKRGLNELKQAIQLKAGLPRLSAPQPRNDEAQPSSSLRAIAKQSSSLPYNPLLQDTIQALATQITVPETQRQPATWFAMRLLEGDTFINNIINNPNLAEKVQSYKDHIHTQLNEDADILLADTRYRWAAQIITQCVQQKEVTTPRWTHYVDKIVLNRFLSIPIFLAIMYCMFLFAISVGGAFQDFFDIASDTLFVQGTTAFLETLHAPIWLTALLANGVGKGINTTLTFIPVIGAMFLFLSFLEDSGYMSRAAFVVDRFMRAMGLPGKAFVPMIVGFGCNVPSVMAARTLDNKRDRILTIMMSPFMSCSARLAIYAVFTAAFFPRHGQNIVFALYLIGIGMAVLTGFVLRKTLLAGEPAPFVLELPPYHFPHIKTLALHAWQRLKGFVFRAGKLIVPICVLIGALNAVNIDGTMNSGEGDVNSLLSSMGRSVTPIFAPMGIHADNWPATVGLVTGVLAKEVVVGSLNTLYSQVGHIAAQAPEEGFQLVKGLSEAVLSIPANLSELGSAIINPLATPPSEVSEGVYNVMVQHFDGRIGAFAYLLFVLLYFPCVSTTAAMLRELHRGWAVFSIFWMTGIAYGTAVFFYQAGTWSLHPLTSTLWMAGVVTGFALTVLGIKWQAGVPMRLATSTLLTVKD